jgi:deoxyribonuclease-4
MIYLGPAGVPTVSKERTTLAGIKCTAELGLNAFECEFVRRVGMSNEMADEVGKLAEKLGIRLSVHCPYFVNLCSMEREKLKASQKRIIDSAERAHHMRADIALFHPGFYGKLDSKEAVKAIERSCAEILDELRSKGINDVHLGLETMGKQSTFGTLEEILEVCKKVKGCVPVIDWAHLNCRYAGLFKTREDYAKVLDRIKPLEAKASAHSCNVRRVQ